MCEVTQSSVGTHWDLHSPCLNKKISKELRSLSTPNDISAQVCTPSFGPRVLLSKASSGNLEPHIQFIIPTLASKPYEAPTFLRIVRPYELAALDRAGTKCHSAFRVIWDILVQLEKLIPSLHSYLGKWHQITPVNAQDVLCRHALHSIDQPRLLRNAYPGRCILCMTDWLISTILLAKTSRAPCWGLLICRWIEWYRTLNVQFGKREAFCLGHYSAKGPGSESLYISI